LARGNSCIFFQCCGMFPLDKNKKRKKAEQCGCLNNNNYDNNGNFLCVLLAMSMHPYC